MGILNIFKKKQEFDNNILSPDNVEISKQNFGVPLIKIKGGDITKPFIMHNYGSSDRYVNFGVDNLFPSIIDQMYYQSPLHSAIIDFQIQTAIGGGYFIDSNDTSLKTKMEQKTFLKTIKIDKLLKGMALDLKMHKRIHLLIKRDDNNKIIAIERIIPSKVRYNANVTKYWVNDNWLYSRNARKYNDFYHSNDKITIYSYIDLESSPGQDIYPLDKTVSVYNWCYLDGESSVLQKKNIEKSIFGSLVIVKPNGFQSDEERENLKKEVGSKEGEIVPVLVLTGDGKDNMPEIHSFPANQNDKAFENLDARIDDKICQAHTINPIIMGIQRPGKLGSGSDINASYPIWEKNVIIPFRKEIENIINDIMLLFELNGEFKLNDYTMIDYVNGDTPDDMIYEENKNKNNE